MASGSVVDGSLKGLSKSYKAETTLLGGSARFQIGSGLGLMTPVSKSKKTRKSILGIGFVILDGHLRKAFGCSVLQTTDL